VKLYVWTTLLLFLVSKPAFSQAELPCLPSLEELVDARLKLLEPRHEAEVRKFETVQNHNDWVDKLFLDRITGTYSFGKGFTVDNTDDGGGRTLVATGRSTNAWAVTYSVPLSFIRQKFSVDDAAEDEIQVLSAKQRLERQEEAIKINLMHNDYLEARRNFSACDRSKPECLAQGYKMRKVAINLLLLTGLKSSPSCLDWNCFLEKDGCSTLDKMILDVQGEKPVGSN
jgi:hypothetical protein